MKMLVYRLSVIYGEERIEETGVCSCLAVLLVKERVQNF
jgi:hypothetical protein